MAIKWKEIRNNYINEEENAVYIDAWKTMSDNEEGKVIAKVDLGSGEVTYLDERAKTDSYAQKMIKEVLYQITEETKDMTVDSWEDMKKKYPVDREEMDEETEERYVEDCFQLYEKEGFASAFWTPYSENEERWGESFEVIERCCETFGCDLCALPMWNIRLQDGTVISAYPEEIIPSEMRENGCKWFDEEDITLSSRIQDANNKCEEVNKEKDEKDIVKTNEIEK